MTAAEDPSVLRRRLLTFLRRQRRTAGLTQLEAADELDWSLSKLIRIETGAQGISVTDLKAILALYSVTDSTQVDSLIADARGSRRHSWWHGYRDIVSPQFAQYLGQESIATSLQVFHPFLVPGLLQTEDYATALHGAFPDPERARRVVELKMERQKRTFANSGRNITFVLNQEALYRQIGGTAGMRQQLLHLLKVAEAQDVMLRIVPFTAGAHAGLGGPFVLLRSDETGDGMVYIESVNGDQLIRDDSESIKQYESYFEQLSGLSLAPKQVVGLLEESINRLDRNNDDSLGHLAVADPYCCLHRPAVWSNYARDYCGGKDFAVRWINSFHALLGNRRMRLVLAAESRIKIWPQQLATSTQSVGRQNLLLRHTSSIELHAGISLAPSCPPSLAPPALL